jgi:hypothetical protein
MQAASAAIATRSSVVTVREFHRTRGARVRAAVRTGEPAAVLLMKHV